MTSKNYFDLMSRALRFAMKCVNPVHLKNNRRQISKLFASYVLIMTNLLIIIPFYLAERFADENKPELAELTENAALFLCISRSVTYTIFLLFWSKKMNALIDRIINDRKSSQQDSSLKGLTNEYCKKEFLALVFFVFGSSIGVSLLMSSIIFSQVNEYHLPLRFVIVLWPINGSFLNWFLNYFYQFLLAVFSSLFLLSYFPLTLVFMNQSCWGLDCITKLLSDLKFQENQENQSTFDRKLKTIILKSFSFMEWHRDVQDLLRINFLVEFSVLSSVLCLSLFTVASNPMGIFIGYVIMQITLGQLFFYCFVGNKVVKSMEALEVAAYEINWYEMNPERAKNFQIILLMAQNMKGFNGIFLEVNMETFQQILEFTFKLFTLLRSTF